MDSLTVRVAGAFAFLFVLANVGSAGAQYYPADTNAAPAARPSPSYRAAPPADDDAPIYDTRGAHHSPATIYVEEPPQQHYRVDQGADAYPHYEGRAVYGAGANVPRSEPSPYGQRYGAPAARADDIARGNTEIERRDLRPPAAVGTQNGPAVASLPPDIEPESGEPRQLPPQFQRQLVDYKSKEPAGTIVIDTQHTYLYLVLGKGKALRYGIGVGREGFTWAGTERISRMAEWPDWHPPEEMIERQPYLPRFMAGGPGNPLGARALYLGKTLYRIHGTNQPSTIGTFVSSGCIRLLNADIEDLYQRVTVGTRVVVLRGNAPPNSTAAAAH
jgi:lipoprotein-anchoring transpeptidase ErfK/SrfK